MGLVVSAETLLVVKEVLELVVSVEVLLMAVDVVEVELVASVGTLLVVE